MGPTGKVAIVFIAIILVGMYVLNMAWGNTLLLAALAVTAGLVGFTKLAGGTAPLTSKKNWQILTVVFVAGFLYMGGYLGGVLPGIGASVGGAGIAPTGGAYCSAKVTPDNVGLASTVDINAYDQEANNPRSAAVDAVIFYSKNGGGWLTEDDTTGNTISAAIGDTLAFNGGSNDTYYVEPGSFCVDSARPTMEVNVHDVAARSEVKVNCYTDDAVTALDSPSGTLSNDQEDWEMDVSANEDKEFYCKFKVNTANRAFNLGAVAVRGYEGTSNTIDDFYMKESGYTKATMPKFLSGTVITLNDSQHTGTDNATGGYDTYYKRDTPLLMQEFDSVKYQFVVEVGTTAPTEDDDSVPTTAAMLFGIFVDSTYEIGSDGIPHLDTYQHVNAEGNVGATEDVWRPQGNQTGFAIELK